MSLERLFGRWLTWKIPALPHVQARCIYSVHKIYPIAIEPYLTKSLSKILTYVIMQDVTSRVQHQKVKWLLLW